MARITIVMLPEPGHLLPTLRIAVRLLERGHQVHYATFPEFSGPVKKLGCGYTPLLCRFYSTAPLGFCGLYNTRRAGVEVYSEIWRKLEVAKRHPGDEILADLAGVSTDLFLLDVVIAAVMGERFQKLPAPVLRVGTNIPEPHRADQWDPEVRRLPEILLCPREFELPDAPSPDHELHFVEPSIFRDRPTALIPDEQFDPDSLLVYCSLGTQSRAYQSASRLLRSIADAFVGWKGYQALIAAGGHFEAWRFGEVPPNVIVRNSVDQLAALARARVFVTHAGLGSVKESIMAGCPMVTLPFLYDQPYNAGRIVHHGIGVSIPPEKLKPMALRTAIEYLAHDRDVKLRMAELRRRFCELEEETPSVRHIESYLATGRIH
jgi:UDP:flavonoid glycosyltransferase YjiC (YdhE family)